MPGPRPKGRMLNRDISDSKGFALLSPEAAVLFCMLVPNYSAYGKMNGDPRYIKGEVCPRVPYLTLDSIPACLAEISAHTAVKWFEHDGRMWIHSTKFLSEHQKLREDRMGTDHLPDYSRTTPGVVPPEVEVEVEVEGEVEDVLRTFAPTGKGSRSKPPAKKWDKLISWDRDKGKFIGISDDLLDTWEKAYPAVNIEAQLLRADEWLKANPSKRKSNYYRFIVNWMSRSQERGGK